MKKFRKYEFGDGRSDRTGTVIAKNYWNARKTVKSTFGLERPFLYRINGK